MRAKLIALAVLIVVGAGALAVSVGGFEANPATATEYLTTEAAVGDVTDEVAATGSLASASTYGLAFGSAPYVIEDGNEAPASDTTWPVTGVAVKPGDSVTAGQTLARASETTVRRELARANADLKSAALQHKIAKEQRADALDGDDTDAARQALLQVYSTQQLLSKATEQRESVLAQLRAATLKSPIDGIVTEVHIATGYDAPAGPAIVIASRELTVTSNVVESDLADVRVGQPASVTIDAIGTTVEGTVSGISQVAGDESSSVVSYPVTVSLPDAPAEAKAGMSADIAITIASATDVVTVPSAALQGSDGDYAVMTLGADGSPLRVPVDVGLVTNASAEIRSGLEAGTPVVIGTAADLIGTDRLTGGRGFSAGGVAVPGGVVRRFDGGGPVQDKPVD
jgi:macrolide-specific efflux system membrane fusion protein